MPCTCGRSGSGGFNSTSGCLTEEPKEEYADLRKSCLLSALNASLDKAKTCATNRQPQGCLVHQQCGLQAVVAPLPEETLAKGPIANRPRVHNPPHMGSSSVLVSRRL